MTRNLDNIRRFCARLGHPEREFPSIHVGGTNGKGTVVATLDSILRAAGLTVGMYTSPHVLKFGERIRVGGKSLRDEKVLGFLDDHWDFIQEYRCTFFEVATAMALDVFRRSGVDVAVVEVGLGGTYDATGIVESTLSIIARIDYDHTDRLGTTLSQIAGDKAGIFRPHQLALISDQQPEVVSVLLDSAADVGVILVRAENVVEFTSLSVTSRGITGAARLSCPPLDLRLQDFTFPLTGLFQVENLRTALAAAGLLAGRFHSINEKTVQQGLQGVSWPGRLQQLRNSPTLLLDVGHNPGAVREVLRSVRQIWEPRRIVTVFSALADKDVAGMMEILKRETDLAFVVPLPKPRGLTLEEIAAMAVRIQWQVETCHTVEQALDNAVNCADEGDVVLAIGSHLLAEEVLKIQKYS